MLLRHLGNPSNFLTCEFTNLSRQLACDSGTSHMVIGHIIRGNNQNWKHHRFSFPGSAVTFTCMFVLSLLADCTWCHPEKPQIPALCTDVSMKLFLCGNKENLWVSTLKIFPSTLRRLIWRKWFMAMEFSSLGDQDSSCPRFIPFLPHHLHQLP